MNSLYNQALKQSNALRKDLDTFESQISPSTSSTDPASPTSSISLTALQGQIQVGLTSLSRTVDDYNNMAKRELIPAKQEKAYSRVKDFRSDLTSLRTKFDNLKKLHSDSILTQNRAELFGRRPYVSSTPENPYSLSENPYGQIKTNSGITRQEGLLREDTFLRRTEGQLDEFIGRGMAVLDNLVEQKGFLKDAQRKVLDAGNTLGLSRDTIRFIERRTTQDKYIFYGGAIFTLVCFYYIYRWARG